MKNKLSKKSKYIISGAIVLPLLIVITVLLVLFIPRKLSSIVPDISNMEKEDVLSFEVIARDPLNSDGTHYSYIADDARVEELVDLINITEVRKTCYNPSINAIQYEIRINMVNGTRKTINLKGHLISGTKYEVITQWNRFYFAVSDTDIEFSGKGTDSNIDKEFSSSVEGITVLTDKASFDQYIDNLVSKGDDGQRLKNYYYETYGEKYFESKSVIMVNYKSSGGEKSIGINSLQIDGTVLNVIIALETDNNAHAAEKYKLFLLEVDTSDILPFTDYQIQIRDLSE